MRPSIRLFAAPLMTVRLVGLDTVRCAPRCGAVLRYVRMQVKLCIGIQSSCAADDSYDDLPFSRAPGKWAQERPSQRALRVQHVDARRCRLAALSSEKACPVSSTERHGCP
eukprot:583725-Pleurochrysis_carterae.AAC.3